VNRYKAYKKVIRKISRVKHCPFCGKIPEITASVDLEPSDHGSTGHYAKREGCCKATGNGQTELFFTNGFKGPNYALWKNMVDRLINNWNRRV